MAHSTDELYDGIVDGIVHAIKSNEPAAEIHDMFVATAKFTSKLQQWRDADTGFNLLQTAVVFKRAHVIPLLMQFDFTYETVPGYSNIQINAPLHLACKLGCLSSIITILEVQSSVGYPVTEALLTVDMLDSAANSSVTLDSRDGKIVDTQYMTGHEILQNSARKFCDCTNCCALANSNFEDVLCVKRFGDDLFDALNECSAVTWTAFGDQVDGNSTRNDLKSEIKFPFQICIDEEHVECAMFLVEVLFWQPCVYTHFPILSFSNSPGNDHGFLDHKLSGPTQVQQQDSEAHQRFLASQHVLYKASCVGNVAFLKLVLKYVGARCNAPADFNNPSIPRDPIVNPLFIATYCGFYDCAVLLLENNTDAHTIYGLGNILDVLVSPMIAYGSLPAFTRLFLSSGVQVSAQNLASLTHQYIILPVINTLFSTRPNTVGFHGVADLESANRSQAKASRINKYKDLFKNLEALTVPFPRASTEEPRTSRQELLTCVELIMTAQNKESEFYHKLPALIDRLLKCINPQLVYRSGYSNDLCWVQQDIEHAVPLFEVLLPYCTSTSKSNFIYLLRSPVPFKKSKHYVKLLKSCLLSGVDLNEVGYEEVFAALQKHDQPTHVIALLGNYFSRDVLPISKCVELQTRFLPQFKDDVRRVEFQDMMENLMRVRTLHHCCKLATLKAVKWSAISVERMPIPTALKTYLVSEDF